MIRQPIVTVCGHVDHGKTSLLDRFRGSKIAEGEAGGITQKISFTLFPAEKIKSSCPLIEKQGINLEIPGFLFIDTPGHAAFTNLRKRGGSLADLAILVIDINEGIMPQTAEVISILKANKTPFLIALNKIDRISGWQNIGSIKESIDHQAINVKQKFQELLFTLIGSLNAHGFESDLFYEVKDFTKKIALVPCSARTGQGIPELIMMLCGLSQRFLKQRLQLGKEAKGVILEIKKEKTMEYIEAIIYDGILKQGDEIAIASFSEPILSKVKTLEEILPLSNKFTRKEQAIAASGIRMQLTAKEEILPGMPFLAFNNNIQEIKKEFKKELTEELETDPQGIIIKADSLGSLEALMTLLRQKNIQILKAGIGKINKKDIISAKSNLENDPTNAIILGFNTEIEPELEQETKGIKILLDEVVYKLIENLEKFQEEKKKEIEKAKLMKLATICKMEILPQFVFRNSKPAVFGVRVLAGKARPETDLIDENDEKIDSIKNIQKENSGVQEAVAGDEVAISLPHITFDRQLKDSRFLYSNLGESQFKEFKKNKDLLSSDEISVLQEISQIKRKTKMTWGV
jgi:translation initiation factor 5B